MEERKVCPGCNRLLPPSAFVARVMPEMHAGGRIEQAGMKTSKECLRCNDRFDKVAGNVRRSW